MPSRPTPAGAEQERHHGEERRAAGIEQVARGRIHQDLKKRTRRRGAAPPQRRRFHRVAPLTSRQPSAGPVHNALQPATIRPPAARRGRQRGAVTVGQRPEHRERRRRRRAASRRRRPPCTALLGVLSSRANARPISSHRGIPAESRSAAPGSTHAAPMSSEPGTTLGSDGHHAAGRRHTGTRTPPSRGQCRRASEEGRQRHEARGRIPGRESQTAAQRGG